MPSAANISRSRPAQNARPSPRITTSPGLSRAIALTISSRSSIQVMFMALSLCGRFSTTSATSSCRRRITLRSAAGTSRADTLYTSHAPVLPRPVRLAQHPPEHLPGGGAGQLVKEIDRARPLGTPQSRSAEGENLLLGAGHLGAQHHHRLDRLAPPGIGHSD